MAIIGISGANGVGKDTVGKIIQYLTSGCDDIMSYGEYQTSQSKYRTDSNWQIRKFASKVNHSYKLITGIDFHSLSREDKELERPRFIKFAESCKDVFGGRIWVNAGFIDYIPINKPTLQDPSCEPIFPNWIFTDVRFEEEVSEIKRHNGIIIYVYKNDVYVTTDKLASNFKDYVIINNGTIEDLIPKVKTILIKEQICKE